jgi:hypothetical protein
MHMTLPVPEHDPHRSPATVTGPVEVWLINGILVPSKADVLVAGLDDAAPAGTTGIAPSPLHAPHVT